MDDELNDGFVLALLADGASCSGAGEGSGRCNCETRRCETPTLYCEGLR